MEIETISIDEENSSRERKLYRSRSASVSSVPQQGFFSSRQLSPISVADVSSSSEASPSASPLLRMPSRYGSFARSFEKKLQEGELLGESSPYRDSNQYCQFNQTRIMAKHRLSQLANQSFEPTPEALHRTTEAMKDFFRLSHAYLIEHNGQFPLANRNKCLGFTIVPSTSLVILAISQDREPHKDRDLRRNMVTHLTSLNRLAQQWRKEGRLSPCWTFELAKIPTREQYLLPRTLAMRSPHQAEPAWVAPRTRCVEVALSTALCKAQRTCMFSLEDICFLTVGGVMWGAKDEAVPIEHFEMEKRNLIYRSREPIEIPLSGAERGYIDVWDPCEEHCQIYMREMLAVASAGGSGTSYTEPRAESDWETSFKMSV